MLQYYELTSSSWTSTHTGQCKSFVPSSDLSLSLPSCHWIWKKKRVRQVKICSRTRDMLHSVRNVEFIDLLHIEICALHGTRGEKRVIYESFQFQCNDKWMQRERERERERERKYLSGYKYAGVKVYFVQMIITLAIILDDKSLGRRRHTSYGQILLFLPLLMIQKLTLGPVGQKLTHSVFFPFLVTWVSRTWREREEEKEKECLFSPLFLPRALLN